MRRYVRLIYDCMCIKKSKRIQLGLLGGETLEFIWHGATLSLSARAPHSHYPITPDILNALFFLLQRFNGNRNVSVP